MGFFNDAWNSARDFASSTAGMATAVNPFMMLGTFAGGAGSAYANAEAQRDANTANAMMQEKQMLFNSREADITRNWEERMSNSAWTRGVADMKAAGINPMAAYSSASASTPSGSTASSSGTPRMDAIPSWATGFMSSAMDALKTFSEVSLKNAETIKARTLTPRMEENVIADTDAKFSTAMHNTMLNKLILADLPSHESKSFTDSNRVRFERMFPNAYGFTDSILHRLGIFGSAAKAAVAYKLLKGKRFMYGADDNRAPWRAYGVNE